MLYEVVYFTECKSYVLLFVVSTLYVLNKSFWSRLNINGNKNLSILLDLVCRFFFIIHFDHVEMACLYHLRMT